MGSLSIFKKTRSQRKLFVLSLDGVPCSFLEILTREAVLPNRARLLTAGGVRRMAATQPAVSSVAWSTYMTGQNPGKHGIFGFVDRTPGSYEMFVPTSRNMVSSTLWEVLSRAGKRVVVVNVPLTYPPRPVNGVLVSSFLCPSLDKVAYPREVSELLKGMGYRIDIDSRLGHTSREEFVRDLDLTLEKRFEAAFALMCQKSWDFSQLHVLETDRMNHVLWEDYEQGASPEREAFLDFYRRLDSRIGDLLGRLPPATDLVLLSDHGFCLLEKEVYLNRFLEERGWLEFEHRPARNLGDIGPGARAYSLAPGRVFLHLRGREPKGMIQGREEYRTLREGLAADLLGLRDPESGRQVIAQVLRGEEISHNPAWGEFPISLSGRFLAPCDLLAVAHDGYDLKGNLSREAVFGRASLAGMHTGHGAFIFIRGRNIRVAAPNLRDLFPTILEMAGVSHEEDIDGECLL